MFKWLKHKTKKTFNRDETEFLPAVLEITEKPPSPIGRTVLWMIIVLVMISICWVTVGYVDEVAVAPGKVIPIGSVKVIQAEDKGVVKGIFVEDGQKVTQGQLLVELDATFSAADLARIKKEIAYYNLEIDRLLAEKSRVPFTPQLKGGADAKDAEFQTQLYKSRQSEFETKRAAASANIDQYSASLESARANQIKYHGLTEIAREKEIKIEQLVSENAVALFVLLDHRSRRLELEQNLSAQTAEIARLASALQQSRHTLDNIIAERNRDIDSKLVEDRKQLMSFVEELKKAEEKERLGRIVAPVSGRVTQLAIHTVGGIVTAAQPLLVIVPEEVTLEVEAWAANKDIGFIQRGQPAEIKIETFSFQKFGTIPAEVQEVSPDSVEDKEKGRIFRVSLKLAKDYVVVGDRQVYLSPGMNANAEIKIREKRIIEFFLDPFRKYQSEALRER